jgi:hypothetical protein
MSRVTEAHHELVKEVTKSRKKREKSNFSFWRRLAGLVAVAPTQLDQAGIFEHLCSLLTLNIVEIRD